MSKKRYEVYVLFAQVRLPRQQHGNYTICGMDLVFIHFRLLLGKPRVAIMASSAQTGSTNDRAFRVFLFEIALEITTDLLDSLKYLCKDDLPKGKLGSIKTAREFLDVLWEGGKIWPGDLNYLTTLLETAQNIQLANWIRAKGMSFYVL